VSAAHADLNDTGNSVSEQDIWTLLSKNALRTLIRPGELAPAPTEVPVEEQI
jgi:hypothetical protein